MLRKSYIVRGNILDSSNHQYYIESMENPQAEGLLMEMDSEPLIGKTKKKEPSTLRDRRVAALAMYDDGHVVNPLGKTRTKGHKLVPSKAKPIGQEGAVTITQLWAAYLTLFESSFGDRTILEGLLEGTRENISRYFDEMRQRFQDSAGYVADNRGLYEYLKWFHEPARISGLIKYSVNKGFVHPNQVLGKVYIRRFYDQIITHKNQPVVSSDNVVKYKHMSDFVRKAFDEIRGVWGTNDEMIYCLVNYGYVIVGEFMHDVHGYGPSESKKSIIETMEAFIRGSSDKAAAINYLTKSWTTTERNSAIESSIWPDWKSTCKDFVELAKQQAESHGQ